MNSTWTRLGVFLLLASGALSACFLFSNAKTNPVAGVIGWLPSERWGFRVVSGEMGVLEKRWLPGDTTYLKNEYIEDFREEREAQFRALHATLIVAGSDSRSLHRPEVCLRGQHWTITKREVVRIPTEGGALDVMDFHLEQYMTDAENRPMLDENGNRVKLRAHYVYWWIGPDASTPSDEKRVWLELWNSIRKGRKERWAYPSVQVLVDDRYGREEAQKRAYEFIAEWAPGFQKSLGAEERPDAVPLKDTAE